jgi:hypothetical protein
MQEVTIFSWLLAFLIFLSTFVSTTVTFGVLEPSVAIWRYRFGGFALM